MHIRKETEDSMDNFYDLNDFIVFLFKKWKTVLAVVLLVVVVFVGNRAFSMIRSYQAQGETTDTEEVSSSDSTEPMWVKAQNIIEIMPEEPKTSDQMTEEVIEAYRKLSGSDAVLGAVSDEWYESEKEEYQIRVEKLHDYGYILDKEVDYPYAMRDFYSQFLVNNEDLNAAARTQDNYDEKYIAVGFRSSNAELAKSIADSYTEKLTAAVQESVGEFSYEIVDQSVLYDLPSASSGTQTTRVASTTSSAAVITVNQIIVQCAKGVVWGVMIGAIVSVILVFLMYMMTKKVYLLSDIRKFNIPVLGTGFYKERGFLKIRAWFHAALEGGNWDETGHKKLVKRVVELEEAYDSQKKIYVTGTCRTSYIKRIAHELNEASAKIDFEYVEGIQTSGKAAAIAKNENAAFILLEKFGESVKDNIEYEIAELNKLETEILGILVLE